MLALWSCGRRCSVVQAQRGTGDEGDNDLAKPVPEAEPATQPIENYASNNREKNTDGGHSAPLAGLPSFAVRTLLRQEAVARQSG